MKDMDGMEEGIKRFKNGKATRKEDSPAEMWKVLMCRRRVRKVRTKQEVKKEGAKKVMNRIEMMIRKGRRRGKMPAQFHWNCTWKISKNNGNVGCASTRLVHGISTLGKRVLHRTLQETGEESSTGPLLLSR